MSCIGETYSKPPARASRRSPRAGLYEFAKAFAHGGISKKELDELQLYDLVSAIAEDMKVRGDNVTVDDIPILLDASSKKAHWQAMSGVSGFLKHADRLPEAMISLQDVNNESLLMHACAAYAMVRHTSTPEMVVFYFFWSAAPGRRAGLDAHQAEIVDYLERLSPSRRRRACMKFIRICKRGGGLP